jgi:preprotein translocase subunit SecD
VWTSSFRGRRDVGRDATVKPDHASPGWHRAWRRPRRLPPAWKPRSRHSGSWLRLISLVIVALAWSAASVSMAASRPLSRTVYRPRLVAVFKPAGKVTRANLDETVRILRDRLSVLRLRDASVALHMGDVVVYLPQNQDARRALGMIGEVGQVSLRPALCGAPPFVGSSRMGAMPSTAALPGCTAASQLTAAHLERASSSNSAFVRADAQLAFYPSSSPRLEAKTGKVLLPAIKGEGRYARYLLGPIRMTGRGFGSAFVRMTRLGRWIVDYTFTRQGTAQWEELAKANFHKIVATVLDGVIQSAPVIEPSQAAFIPFADRGEIADLSKFDAQSLALAIQSGPLPVRLIRTRT